MRNPKLFLVTAAFLAVLSMMLCSRAADAPPARTQPFILGADVTFLLEDEAAGAVFYDKGVKKDFFQILKDNKFNYVRVTSIVEPTKDFSRGDLAHVKILARRAKAAHLGLLVDFFYSDAWANPEHELTPAAWKKLAFPDMVKALHDQTKAVLTALKAQGTTPDIVQIGNEITFGMDWPEGRVTSTISTGNAKTDAHNAGVTNAGGWGNLAALLKAGISATKEVDPNIKIMLHHSLARNDALVHEWIDNLIKQNVPFDIVGLSCYLEYEGGDWKTTFDDIALHYPNLGIIAVEYSGQKRYLNDLVFNTPNQRGLGSFIWSPWRDNETIFDHQVPVSATAAAAATGNSSPASFIAAQLSAPTKPPPPNHSGRYDTNSFMDLYPKMSQDYGNP